MPRSRRAREAEMQRDRAREAQAEALRQRDLARPRGGGHGEALIVARVGFRLVR